MFGEIERKMKKVIVFDETTGTFKEVWKEEKIENKIEELEKFVWTCPLDDETKGAFGI